MTHFAADLYQSPTTLDFFAKVHDHAASMLAISFIGLVVGYVISGLDDFFIDLVAWLKRIRPMRLSNEQLQNLKTRPEKMLAIIIPAWDEGEIIARMLNGNVGRLEYQNFHFFVGCYPNDPATVEAVRAVEASSDRVHCIVNFKDGPTSKGQILNWVVDSVLDWEKQQGLKFDAFIMHDSEDLIHPKSLSLMNMYLENSDFIQIPVFSLARSSVALVAGIYMDEFAESHTKDMLVRKYLGGAIPSAGVGTCLSREFVLAHKTLNNGALFNDQCLTEDYELGVTAGIQQFRQDFAATYYVDSTTGKKDFIATREFFPKSFRRSVRQKTRWTLGIALQSWRSIGWSGTWAQRYFLYRDRKSLITNPLMFIGYIWCVLFLILSFDGVGKGSISFSTGTVSLAAVTGVFAINRIFQRTVCIVRVYGWGSALFLPLRLPIGNVINAFAVVNALSKDAYSRVTRRKLAWVKTAHELPDNFGVSTAVTFQDSSVVMAAEGGK